MSDYMKNQPTSNIGKDKAEKRRWQALGIVLVAAFMDLMDACIVGVAIPVIMKDMGTSYAVVQWVSVAYALAFALLLITGGRLGDIVGHKKMFIIGVAGFTISSVLCGTAQYTWVLIGARVLQGGMAALMIPQVLSIIQITFPPEQRNAAFGLYGGVVGLANVCGPLFGALLTQVNLFGLEWRLIFLINLPIGIFAFFAALSVLEESKSAQVLRLDIVGMLIVTVGLLALIYPMVQGPDLGWPVWMIISMVLSIPLLLLFVRYEKFKTHKDNSPLIVMELFHQKSFVAGLLVNLFVFSGISAFFFVFIIYLQVGLGFSVLKAGLICLPWSLGITIASGMAVQNVKKLGRRLLHIGTLLLIIGMTGIIVTVYYLGTEVTSLSIAPHLVISGLGIGMVTPILTGIVLSGVSESEAGSASGILNTVMQLGSALGIAIIGVIFFGMIAGQANKSVDTVASQVKTNLEAAGVSTDMQEKMIKDFKVSFLNSETSKGAMSVMPADQNIKAQGSSANNERVEQIMEAAKDKAHKLNFSISIRYTLIYEIVVFLISFLLVFLLPKNRGNYNGA